MRRSKGTSTSMGESKSRGKSKAVLRRSQSLLGVSIPSIGSNLLGPRRSDRLCTKSKTSLLAPPSKPSRRSRKPSRCNPKPLSCSVKPLTCSHKPSSIPYLDLGACPITFSRFSDIHGLRRRTRRSNAKQFWHAYSYVYNTVPEGSLNIKERKHILAYNRKEFVDKERSHGMMWVAVHGVKYICAVFKNKAPDMKRIRESLGRGEIMPYFAKHVLWDMEELAERSDYRGKPFAIVSVTRETHSADENCYKASGDEIDEERAVELMKRETACEFTLSEVGTIKAAIAGFHYLYKEKLTPEDIWVTYFHDDGHFHYFRDLDTPEIRKYFEVFNRPRAF